MDWERLIEKNTEALKRVLALLIAMSGLAGDGKRGICKPADAKSLQRHVRVAVFRLLRPAEAAVRRLVIVLASSSMGAARTEAGALLKGLYASGKSADHPTLRATPAQPGFRPGYRPGRPVRRPNSAAPTSLPVSIAFPLIDYVADPLKHRRRRKKSKNVPRIWFFDGDRYRCSNPPEPAKPPPTAQDEMSTARLALRLDALARALGDMPRQAKRYLRWQARRAKVCAQGLPGRWSPLRPGPAPGLRALRPKNRHEIHEILENMQWLAREALKVPALRPPIAPDTS